MSQYALIPEADQDILEIWEYIARDSFDAADKQIRKLYEKFATLAQSPGIGHTCHDLTGHDVLFSPVGT